MKKTLVGLAGMAILLSSGLAMADQVQITMDPLLVAGRAYTGAGIQVPGSYPSNPVSQDLGTNTYVAPDGIQDGNAAGRVGTIVNNTNPAILFDRAVDAYELTLVAFGQDDVMFVPTVGTLAQLYSLGLHIQVYQDFNKDFDILDGSGATEGLLVLDLLGKDLTIPGQPAGNVYDITETYNWQTNTYEGSALLDVIGGAWMPYWDTNLMTSGADLELSFSLNPVVGRGEFTLSGTSNAIGEPVPEPATMLLFGTGLIGLAAVGRRKIRK